MSLIVVSIMLLFNSQQVIITFFDGLTIWATTVLPALLPFMLLSRLLAKNQLNTPAFFGKLTNTPQQSFSVVFISLFSGNPMGTKLISMAHTEGKLTQAQAKKTLLLACTTSPIFIVGTVGIAFVGSNISAAIMLISHLLGMVLNAVLHRNQYIDFTSPQTKKLANASRDIMIDSILAVLMVGGYIAVFYTICQLALSAISITNPTIELALCYLLGLLEMTVGCSNVSALASTFTSTILCTSLVSFGGICIALQCNSFLKNTGIKIGTMMKIKIMHCAISTIISYVMCLILL